MDSPKASASLLFAGLPAPVSWQVRFFVMQGTASVYTRRMKKNNHKNNNNNCSNNNNNDIQHGHTVLRGGQVRRDMARGRLRSMRSAQVVYCKREAAWEALTPFLNLLAFLSCLSSLQAVPELMSC